MQKFLLLVLMSLAFSTIAEESETLTVDRVISNDLELAFPNDKNVKPKASNFTLVNYVVMSNELGERWAVITLSNTSSGSRILEDEHLMALFANGERKKPLAFKLAFEGHETQSMTVSFGKNKFPILSISAVALL